MAANHTNWRHRINKWYISPKACQYPISTRINCMETLFPCPPFLLFVLCLLARSSWNLYAPIGVGQLLLLSLLLLSHTHTHTHRHTHTHTHIIIIIIIIIIIMIRKIRMTIYVHLASLCVFFVCGHVLPCSAWPVLQGDGLAALCLVSRRSVWSRGALLRGLSQCRCECELVNPCESLASRVPVVPLPLCSKYIEEHPFSPSLTLLLVGRTGW